MTNRRQRVTCWNCQSWAFLLTLPMLSSLRQSLLPSARRFAVAPRAFSSTTVARDVPIPSGLPEREHSIWEKLNAKFSPSQLQVEDVSGTGPSSADDGRIAHLRVRRLWDVLCHRHRQRGFQGPHNSQAAPAGYGHTEAGNWRHSRTSSEYKHSSDTWKAFDVLQIKTISK